MLSIILISCWKLYGFSRMFLFSRIFFILSQKKQTKSGSSGSISSTIVILIIWLSHTLSNGNKFYRDVDGDMSSWLNNWLVMPCGTSLQCWLKRPTAKLLTLSAIFSSISYVMTCLSLLFILSYSFLRFLCVCALLSFLILCLSDFHIVFFFFFVLNSTYSFGIVLIIFHLTLCEI